MSTDIASVAAADHLPTNPLTALRRKIEAVEYPPLRVVHPSLPEITLVFSTKLDNADLQRFRRQARISKTDEIDGRKLNGLILGHLSVGIEQDGRAMESEHGGPLSMSSPDFLATFDAATVVDAVHAFIPNDFEAAGIASQVLDACGVGGDVEVVSPTPRP